MIVYITGAALSMWFAYLASCFRKKGQNLVFCILSAIPLTLISAIRYDVGTDYFFTYAPGFQQIVYQFGMRGEQFEAGFLWLIKLIALMTNDYAWMFAVTSVIIGVFTYINIFRQSDSPVMSIFLYMVLSVYFFSLNAVRQAIAISIAYMAIPYVREKKWWAYLICIIGAIFFHASLLVLFPVFLFERIRWTRRNALIVSGIGVASSGLIAGLIQLFLPLIRNGLYFRYMNNTIERSTWSLMIALIFLALALFVEEEDWRVWVAVIGNLIFSILSWMVPLISRVSVMFTYALMLYYPKVLNDIKDDRLRWYVKAVMVVCFCVYVYFTIVVRGGHSVLPYKTIFDQMAVR